MSAVDYQRYAVYVTRCIGRQEQCGVLDIGNASETAKRYLSGDLFLKLLGQQPLHSFGVLDRPGRDAVDANSVAAPFDGQISGDRIYSRFGGRNVDLHRGCEVMQGCGNVEDLPL